VFVQDKEVASGGTAPRMLCLDDYFVIEVEKVVTDPESGKKVKKMVIIIILSFISSCAVLFCSSLSCHLVTLSFFHMGSA